MEWSVDVCLSCPLTTLPTMESIGHGAAMVYHVAYLVVSLSVEKPSSGGSVVNHIHSLASGHGVTIS